MILRVAKAVPGTQNVLDYDFIEDIDYVSFTFVIPALNVES